MTGCCLKHRLICPSKQLFVDVAVVAILLAGLTVLHHTAHPVQQGFFCNDDSISLPYRPNTVNSNLLIGVTFAGALLLMLLAELPRIVVHRNSQRESTSDGRHSEADKCSVGRVACAYGAYVYGYLVINLATEILKLTTGELRPHFLAVCQPNVNLQNCTGYVDKFSCTNKNVSARELQNAQMSFPSGHASLAFYFATFLVLYLEARVQVSNYRLPKLTLQAGLVITAFYVSATRISDFHHRYVDVFVGGLLGVLVALVTFVQVARHWLLPTPKVEPEQNCNNSNTDVDLEAAEPSTPTPLLSKFGLGIQEKSANGRSAHIGPLRLQIG